MCVCVCVYNCLDESEAMCQFSIVFYQQSEDSLNQNFLAKNIYLKKLIVQYPAHSLCDFFFFFSKLKIHLNKISVDVK